MNRFGVVILLSGFSTFLQAEKYTSRWDNIDIDEILNSERLLENYKNCLMEKGRCTAEGTELKKNLPDALKTECSKCTAKQKENTEKVINYMIENKKAWWEELQSKYDPSGIYYSRYLEKKKLKEGNPKEDDDRGEKDDKKNEKKDEKKDEKTDQNKDQKKDQKKES